MTSPTSQDSSPGSLPVITPHGEFDYQTVPLLQTQIDTAVAIHGGVILDATDITFTDSVFLTMLLATHQRSRLRIVNLPQTRPSPQHLRRGPSPAHLPNRPRRPQLLNPPGTPPTLSTRRPVIASAVRAG
ncbi:STAS domain-containing protein [Streptomyces sp. PgraA7]|uniref:STAS domain-containing protein n=1 Tax=unclassified Streptomyces TaxID=2593676 RepID=UPI0031F44883